MHEGVGWHSWRGKHAAIRQATAAEQAVRRVANLTLAAIIRRDDALNGAGPWPRRTGVDLRSMTSWATQALLTHRVQYPGRHARTSR